MIISSGKQTESDEKTEDIDDIDDHVYEQAYNVFIPGNKIHFINDL